MCDNSSMHTVDNDRDYRDTSMSVYAQWSLASTPGLPLGPASSTSSYPFQLQPLSPRSSGRSPYLKADMLQSYLPLQDMPETLPYQGRWALQVNNPSLGPPHRVRWHTQPAHPTPSLMH